MADEVDEDISLLAGRPMSHIAKDADTIEHEYGCLRDVEEKLGTRLWLMRRTKTFGKRNGKAVPGWSHMSREPEKEFAKETSRELGEEDLIEALGHAEHESGDAVDHGLGDPDDVAGHEPEGSDDVQESVKAYSDAETSESDGSAISMFSIIH